MTEDQTIIKMFFERSEQAIWELDAKYGEICRRLSRNIVNSREDAEECVSDAYFGAWNAIPPAAPDPLPAYICKIVRNISLKRYYRNEAAKRGSVYTTAMEESLPGRPRHGGSRNGRKGAHAHSGAVSGHAVRPKPRNFHAPLLVFRQLQGDCRICRAFGEKCQRPADPHP